MNPSFLALALVVAITDPPVANEDDQKPVGHTVVTARKRAESIDRIPASVTSVSADEIEAAGMRSLADAARLVPNLNLTEFTSRRLSFPFIRGVGSGQGEAGVVTYIDGVPQLTTGSTNLPLAGLDRIEFLRGPQGVLYGRNALGGVIHLHSRRPSTTPEFGVGIGLGNYDLREVSASYSGPIGRGESAPLVGFDFNHSRRSGYTKNQFTGNDVDDRDAYFGRAQTLFTPGDNTEVRVSIYGERARDGGFALTNVYPAPLNPLLGPGLKANPHRLSQDFEGVAERSIIAPSVNWTVFGDAVDFTSITSYQDWDILETSDFDFSFAPAVIRTTEEDQQYFSQELRWGTAESRRDENSVSWLAGVQAFVAESGRASQNNFLVAQPPAIPFPGVDSSTGRFRDYGIGLFAEGTIAPAENVEVTAGLRYDHETKRADLDQTFYAFGAGTPVSNSRPDEDYGELLPSVSAAVRPDESTTIYASASKGYKAGGFNLTAPVGQLEYNPEENWSYEFGVKRTCLDGRAAVRLAVFYIDWEDMQLNVPPLGGVPYVDNAGDSTSNGIELEATTEVCDNLSLFGGIGHTDTEFDNYTDPFGNNVAGKSLPFAPETTWNLGVQTGADIGQDKRWFTRLEYVGVGDFYYDPNNTQKESFELLNASAGVECDTWSFSVWARNLTDEEYVPVALQINPADSTFFVGESGEPFVIGGTLRASF
jgi:iron complex outermembrane receptor protein